MYIPAHNLQTNPFEIERIIRNYPFAQLITVHAGLPEVTHIPILYKKSGVKILTLAGHVSRANMQWEHWNDGTQALVVFNGPHHYISSSWYIHESVPTWNYIAVHMRGLLRMLSEEESATHIAELMETYEPKATSNTSLDKVTPGYIEGLMRGIVPFEISITSIEAKFKLSQNKKPEDRQAVIDHLEKCNTDDARTMIQEILLANTKA